MVPLYVADFMQPTILIIDIGITFTGAAPPLIFCLSLLAINLCFKGLPQGPITIFASYIKSSQLKPRSFSSCFNILSKLYSIIAYLPVILVWIS